MNKILILIVIGFFLTSGLTAQKFKKEWSEGKLTWQDFTEKPSGKDVSELRYFLGYNTQKKKYGDTTVIRNVAQCYIDKSLSYIKPEYKTNQYLRYNQVIFDIVEIYRRKLQYEMDRISPYAIGDKFNHIYYLCNNEIDQFYKESEAGQNPDIITHWGQKVVTELKALNDDNIPEFENRNFGYALHAGLGTGSFAGTLGEYFSPSFNFIFGFDLAYKKSILYLNGTLASCKVKRDYVSDQNWNKGQNANLAIIDVSYGYALLDNHKIKLSPFVGLGITELTAKSDVEDEDNLSLVDYNMIMGLNADYKLRTRLNLASTSSLGMKEKVETSLRARLYVTRVNYYDDLKGYSINLTIGLCGFGNMIRFK